MKSVYDKATGLFTGVVIVGNAQAVDQNTPDGCGVVDGQRDHLRQRVDLATGQVVDWQPPAPPADEWQTWDWNADNRRWISIPTRAAIAKRVRAERDARMAACDWVVSRAVETNAAIPAEWAAYRAALRDLPSREGFPDGIEWPAPPA